MELTVEQIKERLACADAQELAVLERSLAADARKGVGAALRAARRRIDAQAAESARLGRLYGYERELADQAGARVVLGLDEAGRGPLAGPLAVGAVVLGEDAVIEGLDDSKRLSDAQRRRIAGEVKARATAWHVQFVEPDVIDERGISTALKCAFHDAICAIEEKACAVDIILLDGNPLHLDARERNVVKGDSKCASIAAASVVAKVARDDVMKGLDGAFPGYGFASNKGYGTAAHIEAIGRLGLSPVHRKTFCLSFTQQSLF